MNIKAVFLSGMATTILSLVACSKPDTPQANLATEANQTSTSASIATSTATVTATPTPATTPTSSLRAYVDPVTGELRAPTAAELTAETAARKAAAAVNGTANAASGTEEIALPDGMVEVRLGRSARIDEVACVQPDGSVGKCPAKAGPNTTGSKSGTK